MGKSKKVTLFYCNVVIFIGLVGLYYRLKQPIVEGIASRNCCGGIEAGVHYSETDRKPPEYVRRCFQSSGDGSGGTDYKWDGFPCTNKDSGECCGGKGTCNATSKGGYCKTSDGSTFTYRKRGGDKEHSYIKRSNDNILDINEVNDMKDYYYDRKQSSKTAGMSKEMQRFMARRSKNETYMEQQLITKRSSKLKDDKDAKTKLVEQQKNIQMVYWITLLHLLVLVIIAVVIRGALVAKIQGFLDIIYLQYLKYSGKTVKHA